MSETRTRYIRLVDGEPTSLSFTEAGDVPGGVEVGMEFVTASGAFVPKAVAGLLVDGPAPGALLTGVPCVDVEHGLPCALGLVIDEPLKLAELPVAERSVEAFSQLLPLSDTELFQRYRIERLCNYPVSYLVVHVGHEAVLLLRQTLQFTFGGAGAFGLKFTTKVLIAALDRSDVIGIIELVVGEDSVIEYASIDTEDGGRRSNAGSPLLHDDAKDEMLSIEGQFCRYRLPVDELLEVFGNTDLELDPPGHAGQGNDPSDELSGERSLVVPNGRPSALDRESFQLFPFEHIGGAVPCCSYKGCGDARITFTNGIVCQMVQYELIDHPSIETDHENVIGCHIDRLDGLDKTLVSRKMQGDRTLHNISLVSMVYFNNAPIPSHLEKRGIIGGIL